MCINKKQILNKKYTMNKKNGGNIPPLNDPRQLYIMSTCGQCYICKRKKGREWRMRIAEDVKVNKNAKVVMLTFSTESLKELAEEINGLSGYELENQICRLAVKRFRERWRKKYKRSIRHWFITELGHGKTEHIHMHGIVWSEHERLSEPNENGIRTKEIIKHDIKGDFLDEVEKMWQYGYVGRGKRDWQTGKWINYVNERTANYFVKYVTKIDEQHKEYKQIILTSAGIGKCFLESEKAKDNTYRGKKTLQTYQVDHGGVLPMPEYFRRKLYNDDEREKLTTHMLDKGMIYIDGKEYRADIGDDKINLMNKALQEKNARMGYGDGRKNYDRIRYENARRRQIQRKRGIIK